MWFNLAQADAFLNDTDSEEEEEEARVGLPASFRTAIGHWFQMQ
tara:strand:+ start:155 stop:286 length:132 start_codon:yes stop_codon:yes gene_type:complete